MDPAIKASGLGWVVVVFFTGLGLLALRNVPRIWRGETRYYDRPQPWWPWGETLWRGLVRYLPTATVNGLLMVLVFVVFALVPTDDLPILFKVSVFLWIVELLVTLFSIPLFNWPKALVPPQLRDEPGAMSAWLRGNR